MKKKITSILSCIILLLVIGGCRNSIKFDSKKWKNWKQTENNLSLRWKMSGDLIENHHIKGMTKKEVFELLGKPTLDYENSISYNLGYSENGVDNGALILVFKEDTVYKINLYGG